MIYRMPTTDTAMLKCSANVQDTRTQDVEGLDAPQQQAATSPWLPITKQDFDATPHDILNASRSGNPLISFRSPASHRLQMQVQSSHLWFPNMPDAELQQAYSFMLTVNPECPALAAAQDAAALVQVGQNQCDTRLSLAGHRLYIDALTLLRVSLSESTIQQGDALIAAINVLQTIETNTTMMADTIGGSTHPVLHASCAVKVPPSVGLVSHSFYNTIFVCSISGTL